MTTESMTPAMKKLLLEYDATGSLSYPSSLSDMEHWVPHDQLLNAGLISADVYRTRGAITTKGHEVAASLRASASVEERHAAGQRQTGFIGMMNLALALLWLCLGLAAAYMAGLCIRLMLTLLVVGPRGDAEDYEQVFIEGPLCGLPLAPRFRRPIK